jgi:hypothetical protein
VRGLGRLVLAVPALGLGLWGAAALIFAGPEPALLRQGLAGLVALVGLLGTADLLRGRTGRGLLLAGALALALVLWWSRILPSNERVWAPEVARLATVRIEGDAVLVRNLRNFRWLHHERFEERWEERHLTLSALDSLDLVAVYWMGEAIAHVILSFGFGPERIAVSIEIRKEAEEAYDALAGFFRRYELVYVVGDERDLLGGRALRRDPVEDIYLYRVRIGRERLLRLFLDYVVAINDLAEQPRWYNTATTNCTTTILTHTRAYGQALPLTWKVLLSGYFPDYVRERGALAADLPMAELKARSRINAQALEALEAPDFSARIRDGLPGPTASGTARRTPEW